MSVANLEGIIRSKLDHFTTPNIYNYLGNGLVEINHENFRLNQQDRELILFVTFEGQFYLPLWFEFRSINNNLLFLLKEYKITSFKEIKKILLSSLEKEEHYTCDIKAIVYKTKELPRFMIRLDDLEISEDDLILVEEK